MIRAALDRLWSLTEAARDAAPAAGGVVAASVGGAAVGLPSWLIGVGQAAVVVLFTLRGIDKRLAEIRTKQAELGDAMDALRHRVRNLDCQLDVEVTDPCRPLGG